MIEFMVLALPRSGTTWAANWLTTDTTLCLHDPIINRHYEELDSIESKKMLGISCTGLFMFPEFINRHPARKVILHRPLEEINESLGELGLPLATKRDEKRLSNIKGAHMDWMNIFNKPDSIYYYLLQKPFDRERHTELALIEMQPRFSSLTPNAEVMQKLVSELRGT